MAKESARFNNSHLTTIANAITALDAFIDEVDARLDDIGDAGTRAVMSVTLDIYCADGSSTYYTHSISITTDTGTVTAGQAKVKLKITTAALSVLATAVEGASTYTTVKTVNTTARITMEN